MVVERGGGLGGKWVVLPCLRVCNTWGCRHSLAGQSFQLSWHFWHFLAKNRKRKEKEEEESCKEPDWCGWLEPGVPSQLDAVVSSHGLSSSGSGGMHWGVFLDATAPPLLPNSAVPAQDGHCSSHPLDSRATKALGESFQSEVGHPILLLCPSRHPAGDKQRL